MKILSSAYITHGLKSTTTFATGLKLVRQDSAVYGFTTHDVDDTIDGVVYNSDPGLEATSITIGSGGQVGNLELTTLHDGTLFTTIDLLGGIWRNAAFTIFRYNYANLTGGTNILLAGNLGEIAIKENSLIVELRDIRQYLQQMLGSPSSKTCRYRLGSTSRASGGLCMKDISAPPFTMPGTVTTLSTQSNFLASDRTEDDDFFGEGLLTWNTGNNAGQTMKIRYFSLTSFVLALPAYGAIELGDTFTAVVGCRKFREICMSKFDNVLNFGGEPDRPTVDDVTEPLTLNV